MSPQVGTVGKGLVIHLKDNIVHVDDSLDIGSQNSVRVQFKQAGIVRADTELRLRAAHAARRVARHRGLADLHALHTAARLCKSDQHALPDIRRAADAVDNPLAGIYAQQMQLLGVGMLFHLLNPRGDNAAHVPALVKDILHFSRGKGKALNQRLDVQSA